MRAILLEPILTIVIALHLVSLNTVPDISRIDFPGNYRYVHCGILVALESTRDKRSLHTYANENDALAGAVFTI